MTRLSAIAGFRLVTAEPARLAAFYGAIGFVVEAQSRIPAVEMALLGIPGGGTRTMLRLGLQHIALDTFERAGRPFPAGGTVADTLFQHLAIVTSDAAAAWALAKTQGADAISTHGAVTLPRSSGGVTAVKLRDPDGHPLEFLQFPLDADTRWRGEGMLGIDHSAICIADASKTTAFYETLGLRVGRSTHNRGPAQDALDGLAHADVDVVPLLPEADTPHLELLGYRYRAGQAACWMPNDVAATRIVWHADEDAVIADPDGHLHQLSR